MDMSVNTVETLTRLAEQFGPFLFAILFILVVTRTAHGYYRDCMTRTAPPSTEQEQKTYRSYFLCSVWVGIVVMGLSIGWWFYVQARGNNVYQIAILDLGADEQILSNYFAKNAPHPTMAGLEPIHDAYFLVVRDHPFEIGDRLAFQYFKVSAKAGTDAKGVIGTQIELKYAGGHNLTYKIILKEAKPQLEVASVEGAGTISPFTEADLARAQKFASVGSVIRDPTQ
jgi:hypothetical protein